MYLCLRDVVGCHFLFCPLTGDDGLLGDPLLDVVGVEPEGGVDPDVEAVLEVVVLVVVPGVLQVATALVAALKKRRTENIFEKRKKKKKRGARKKRAGNFC